MDKTRMLEKANRDLARRNTALQATLEEITELQKVYNETNVPELQAAINQAIVKRNRQHLATKATEAIIKAFGKPPKRV